MTVYHSGLPTGLPPSSSQPVAGSLYRGIKQPPLAEGSFLSEAELGNPNADPADPKSWGLSVWRTAEAVAHARGAFKWMRKWHIALGQPSQGRVLETPSNNNPHHCTWWKPLAYDPCPDFAITIFPVP